MQHPEPRRRWTTQSTPPKPRKATRTLSPLGRASFSLVCAYRNARTRERLSHKKANTTCRGPRRPAPRSDGLIKEGRRPDLRRALKSTSKEMEHPERSSRELTLARPLFPPSD